MLLAVSKLVVPEHRQGELEARFRGRPKLVDGHPGFRRLQLVKARGTGEYLLLLEWDDLASFQGYAKSAAFEHAHDDLDGDVKPGGLRVYDLVLDSGRGE